MELKGYIKLFRKIEHNPLWLGEKFTNGQAWIDLLLLANHKEKKFLKRGCWVTVKRGQVGWSVLALAERWKWSRHKVDNFLSYLQSEQQILIEKSHVTTIISINNYESYQDIPQQNEQQNEQQKDNKRTTEGQQKDTNNNDKNVKNINNTITREENFENSTDQKKEKFHPREDYSGRTPFEQFCDMTDQESMLVARHMNEMTGYLPSPEDINTYREKFILKITADGDIYRDHVSAYKSYFNNWIVAQYKKEKNEQQRNNPNGQPRSKRDQKVADFLQRAANC